MILSKIRELNLTLNKYHWIFYNVRGKTFIVKHKSSKYKIYLSIVPTSNGYSIMSSDYKYKAGVKNIKDLEKQIKKIFPKI